MTGPRYAVSLRGGPNQSIEVGQLRVSESINNRLSDFRHMAELFTRRDEAYFGRTLGVNNLSAHFNNMEKALRARVGHDVADVSGHLAEVQDFLASDAIFQHLVVQRS